jgi:hypothetical protein
MVKSCRPMLALLCAVVACSAWALPLSPQAKQKKPAPPPAQQQTPPADQTPPPPPDDADKPKTIAPGTAPTLKESRQRKEAASAGYNGLGDDGTVTTAALNSTPSSADSQKALRLSVYAVSEAEVQTFIAEGNLGKPAGK